MEKIMNIQLYKGNCLDKLKELNSNSIDSIITSPPYFRLRDYGHNKQIGREDNINDYVTNLVQIFNECNRVLKPNGTFWLNLGDSYIKGNLVGAPWKVAFALQKNGWILRQDIIWNKPNCMPESVKNRFVKSHEYVFLFVKNNKYFFDSKSVKEPLSANSDVAYRKKLREKKNYNSKKDYKNNFPKSFDVEKRSRRSVWSINTKPFNGAHCAPFPEALVEPCILSGCPVGGVVIDPFMGSGTVGVVAKKTGRDFIGIELNPEYLQIAKKRVLGDIQPIFENENKIIASLESR